MTIYEEYQLNLDNTIKPREYTLDNPSPKRLTTMEAVCVVAGYGIGSGVMAVPLFVSKVGVGMSIVIILAAYFVSVLFHLLLAELSLKTGGGQIISTIQKLLFKGKYKAALTWTFFILMGINLLGNLAIYVSGAGEIMADKLGINIYLAIILFYVFAAGISFFGLKIIGVCEKYAIFAVLAILAVLTAVTFSLPKHPLPLQLGSVVDGIGLFGKIMFVFVAFFSVPQVVDGLNGDAVKIRKSIIGGMGINLFVALLVALCTLLVAGASLSDKGIAIIDWTKPMPTWAAFLGAAFTLLAFLTTYWSISLALADIIKEQLKTNSKLSWLIATLPSLAMVLLAQLFGGGFLDFINLAGGVIAILVVFMVIPIMRRKEFKYDKTLPPELSNPVLKRFASPFFIIVIVIGHIAMAIGSLVGV